MSDRDMFVVKIGDQIPVQLVDDPDGFTLAIYKVLEQYEIRHKFEDGKMHPVNAGQVAAIILDHLGPAGFWSTFRVKGTERT